jgi:mRNA-degrading endonuclease RelE of RelBE toxin-antitoxin system
MYRVELSKRALRDLRRIEHQNRKRLLQLVERVIDRRELERAAATLST